MLNDISFAAGFASLGIVVGIVLSAVFICQPVSHSPALVGYGCEGVNGPIYADGEDSFPRCAIIEKNRF